ncbi:MAG TPA: tRNA lysidine(34) synthetase TilS [Gallionella sp.]|nr:tRNA lysidine(34) synthetase TilS [Gallionella sp.]
MVTDNILVERVAALIAPLVPAHGSILVGLSGGVDSVVLLHVLHNLAARYDWQISALHVHHGISRNADAWAKFCAELCERDRIPFQVEQVDIAPLRAHGIEAAARKLRLAAFSRQPCDYVALAHHADDQAETLLLQMLRGAGVRGASAMPVLSLKEPPAIRLSCQETPARPLVMPRRPMLARHAGSPALLRPLLHCSRREILDYAVEFGLQWVEDDSNSNDSYPRNYLRHRVMPLLTPHFPAYRETLGRSARHFAEATQLLDELARLDAGQALDGNAMRVEALRALSSTRAKNLLRYFLHTQGAPMPQSAHLDEMLRQLCDARQDAAVEVRVGEFQLRRYRDCVYLLPETAEFDRALSLPWQGEAMLDWVPLAKRLHFSRTTGAGISFRKLQHAPVTLRLRNGAEVIRPHPAAAKRTLKNLLQQHRIPPWERVRLPLLFCGEDLACVVGVAIDADYLADESEDGVLVSCS